MCSYIVEKAKLLGSAKGANGWMRIDTANVYYDHPFHSALDHVLGIDFTNEAEGGRERVLPLRDFQLLRGRRHRLDRRVHVLHEALERIARALKLPRLHAFRQRLRLVCLA